MAKPDMSCRRYWTGALLVIVVSLGGCGSNERPMTIPVTGRVTIDGQPPGENGMVYFSPTHTAEGYPRRPADGRFTADGFYSVMSWEPGDGLVPGHYTVSVSPGDSNNTRIPERYQQKATSRLELEVPVEEDEIEYNIDLVTK